MSVRNDISPLEPSAPPPAPGSVPKVVSTVTPGAPVAVREIGGASGPDPTRYGDWERAGRCIDF